MQIMKLAPAAAMALSGAALLILALAPLGTALGWWHFGFGLYWMMPTSGYIAATAVALAVATLALGWSTVRPRGRLALAVALVMGMVLAYVPWQYQRIRSTLPPIHDITTDTDTPPEFVAVLPARAAESAGSVVYDHAQLPVSQQKAYPDLAPIRAAMPVASAFDTALKVAKAMPGWTIVAVDADAGRIEASQQSRWFRFTDDIVIRIAGTEAESRIDMRSTSRQGRSDYGVNAARIRAYMAALRKRLG
jgi:uncharacterized protein (DUF1499 family)